MTGAEIIRLVRLKIDDTQADDYGWSDIELIAALNESIDDLTTTGLLIKDRSTSSICSISITALTAEYTLSPRIILINEPIWLTTLAKPIYAISEGTLYSTYGNAWATQSGDPSHYIADIERRKIKFFPIPTANETATLDVYRTMATRFTADNIGTVTPEIGEEWHYKLIHGILVNAYDKNDVETRDMPGLTVATAKWANAIEAAKRFAIKTRYKERRIAPPRGLIC